MFYFGWKKIPLEIFGRFFRCVGEDTQCLTNQKRISIPTLSQASERNFKEAMARGYVVGYVPLPGSYFVGLHDFQLWQFVRFDGLHLPGLVVDVFPLPMPRM